MMMPDMEKVINGLESCVVSKTKCFFNRNEMCPYFHVDVLCCEQELMRDALALLKEQEAVEPIKMQRMDGNFSFFVPYFLCGNCRYELVGKDVMFCSHCGKKVKWE